MRSTLATLISGLALVASLEGGAEAGTILVFGDHAGRADAADRLEEAGHTAQIAGVLPSGDLSQFDVLWHIGVATQFDDATRNRLGEFMKNGGGVLLTGEWDCCETMNASIEQVVNRFVAASAGAPTAVMIGGQGTAAPGTHYWNPEALGGITMAPQELVAWRPGTSGKIAGIQGPNVLSVDEDGAPTGAVWAGGELVTGGQLVVLMDSDWYAKSGAGAIVENLAAFLIEGVPPPEEPVDWQKPDVSYDVASPLAGGYAGSRARELGDDDELTDDDLAAGCSAGGGAGGLGLIGLLGAVALVNRKKR